MTKDTERAARQAFEDHELIEAMWPVWLAAWSAALAQEAQAVPEGSALYNPQMGSGVANSANATLRVVAPQSVPAQCAHKFVPYYEGVELCEKCKATQSVPAQPVAWRAENVGAIYDQMQKSAPPAAEQDVPRALTDEQRQAVRDALSMALGDSYDCTRVWSAWRVGTMGPDDFVLITDDADRVAEIADAAIDAILTAAGAK